MKLKTLKEVSKMTKKELVEKVLKDNNLTNSVTIDYAIPQNLFNELLKLNNINNFLYVYGYTAKREFLIPLTLEGLILMQLLDEKNHTGYTFSFLNAVKLATDGVII